MKDRIFPCSQNFLSNFSLRQFLLSLLILVASIVWISEANACEAIDGKFAHSGELLTTSDQVAGRMSKSLATMLDVAYEKKVGDPLTVALLVNVDAGNKTITVAHQLTIGRDEYVRKHMVVRDVECIGDDWLYEIHGTTSADGAYRSYSKRVFFKVVPNGELLVRREMTIERGILFRDKTSYYVTAKFPPTD